MKEDTRTETITCPYCGKPGKKVGVEIVDGRSMNKHTCSSEGLQGQALRDWARQHHITDVGDVAYVDDVADARPPPAGDAQ